MTAVFAFAVDARAAETPSCGELPCRANGLAYVSEAGGIVIVPGEAFSVELKIEDGKIVGLTPRRRQSDLPNSIELDFSRSNVGLMLKQTSHVNATTKTEGYIKLADGRFVRTSMCPLRANLATIELWYDRIEFIELRNFRIVTDDGAMACD
jgi:hypothetical protein